MPVEITEVSHHLAGFIEPSELLHSPQLSEMGRCQAYFKLENQQPSGSFKVRGAFSKIIITEGIAPDLPEDEEAPDKPSGGATQETKPPAESEPPLSYVAASTGNHGAALAYAAKELKRAATVFVPERASPAKIANIAQLGARVVKHGTDCVECETHARQFAKERGMVYVSPYNDPEVIAGQGTIADELIAQFEIEPVDVLIAAVGGGGLIAGVGSRLKELSQDAEVIGVSPENSTALIDSLAAGHAVPDKALPTLSDATAGGIEEGSITIDLCRKFVDHFTTVSEEDIARTLKWFVSTYDIRIEGAAAVAIAGFLKLRNNFAGKNVVVLICGGNIDEDALKAIMNS